MPVRRELQDLLPHHLLVSSKLEGYKFHGVKHITYFKTNLSDLKSAIFLFPFSYQREQDQWLKCSSELKSDSYYHSISMMMVDPSCDK